MRLPTHRRSRAGRGVTLLEVAVVAAIASVIFLLLIRWLLTLAAVDSAALSTATASRSSSYTESRLSADLASATGCTSYGSPPVRILEPDRLSVYTIGGRSDGTTGMQLVTWKLADGALTRSSVPVADAVSCTTADPELSGDTAQIATGVSAASLFTSASGGDCQLDLATGQSYGTACTTRAVTVKGAFTATGPEPGRSTINRTYTLPETR